MAISTAETKCVLCETGAGALPGSFPTRASLMSQRPRKSSRNPSKVPPAARIIEERPPKAKAVESEAKMDNAATMPAIQGSRLSSFWVRAAKSVPNSRSPRLARQQPWVDAFGLEGAFPALVGRRVKQYGGTAGSWVPAVAGHFLFELALAPAG